MVLTPKQALEKIKPRQEELKDLEKKIDEAILKNLRTGSRTVTIDASIFPDNAAYEAIKEKYTGAGWNVKYECDQRDGNYVQLTERKKAHDSSGLRPDYLC